MPPAPSDTSTNHRWLIPLAALIATLPLILHGNSCGHDFSFHLQSWIEAASQLRHGAYPQWAFSAAWQAGEPRFLFYPPISWLFGALLSSLFPIDAVPPLFIFSVLTAAGLSLYTVARRFASANAALIAACVYLATPYMFFNAYERSAFAELFASIWIPLLFLAALRDRPTLTLAALPLALAWLTNVPSGIMATYTFAALAILRLFLDWRSPDTKPTVHRNLFTFAAGLILGLALPAFYLVPAVIEHRYVQANMAIIPNLRYQDNFLFSRTAYEPHNVVTHTVSVLAVAMLLATACALVGAWIFNRPPKSKTRRNLLILTVLFASILFLLLPISAFAWHFAPELPFLQFPWRLLTILSAVLALAVSLALREWRNRNWLSSVASVAIVAAITAITSHAYRQECDDPHFPQILLDLFRQSHGVAPTDEYTPAAADNDVLRTDSPGYWLAPPENDDAYAPNTVPNPNETDPNWDDSIPLEYTIAQHAPTHLTLNLAAPEVLVLNLRDYPAWQITRTSNGSPAQKPAHVQRDDGLLAIELPAGPSTVDITWRRGPDLYAGEALSAAALITLLALPRRSRKINL